jgi:hypothetical protein
VGNKWGGKYLRAPDIFFTVLEKGEDKLVRLGDVAEIRRGFTTGVNEFFYVEDMTDEVTNTDLFKIRNLHDFSTVDEIKKAGNLRIIRTTYNVERRGRKEKSELYFIIEKEYLEPVIKSPKESKTIVIKPEELKYKVLMCNKGKKELQNSFVLDYIKWGEERGYNTRPSCSGRKYWWDITNHKRPDIVIPCGIGDTYRIFVNPGVYVDKRLYEGFFPSNPKKLALILNSSFYAFMQEINSRVGLGDGLLDLTVYEVAATKIVNPEQVKMQRDLLPSRPIKSIFEELNINPSKPIREQDQEPLPDRAKIDNIIFDVLGLTEEERKEVYWSVCELVKSRLEKARSLKR